MRAFISKLRKSFDTLSAVQVEVIGFLLILIGAVVDLYTSDHLSPLLFYIPPVIFVAWASESARGWIHVGIIAVVTFAVAFLEQRQLLSGYIVAYNSVTLVATIALVYWA